MASKLKSAYQLLVGIAIVILGLTSSVFGVALDDKLFFFPGVAMIFVGLIFSICAHIGRRRAWRR